jgi:signal transduction histidine kinase/FixJ family two-component response regulator
MVLIVDDKKENLLSLKSLLTLHGYEVHAAESGEEALKNVLHHSYSLIILDVQMPGMDGFEVAEMISGYSKTNEIPIIFLSAVNTDKKFITRGYSSGAIDYITKPIDPDIFLLKVNSLFNLYQQKRELNKMQNALRSEIEFRKKAQEDSQVKAQELVSILESIPQIAFTTTPDGQIEYCNNEWLNYSGSSSQFPRTHPEEPSIEDLISKMADQKKPLECEIQLNNPTSNEYRCFLLRAVPVLKENEIIKWVGTFTDIEDQKLASKRKDEFISVASHELKTPLSSMKGYIQLLERALQPGQPGHLYVKRSLVQINKLDTLIADLLDISKMESGKLKLDMDDFNFEEMLSNAIETIGQTFSDFTIERKGKSDVMVRGDQVRLEQVVLNYLSNAIKYSPELKKVIVHTQTTPNNMLELRVQDFGIGIAKEDQPFVFDKFYRTVQSSNHFQGLGLGLYICADILQRHGAQYGVHSEPGKGSEFYFKIPYITKSN